MVAVVAIVHHLSISLAMTIQTRPCRILRPLLRRGPTRPRTTYHTLILYQSMIHNYLLVSYRRHYIPHMRCMTPWSTHQAARYQNPLPNTTTLPDRLVPTKRWLIWPARPLPPYQCQSPFPCRRHWLSHFPYRSHRALPCLPRRLAVLYLLSPCYRSWHMVRYRAPSDEALIAKSIDTRCQVAPTIELVRPAPWTAVDPEDRLPYGQDRRKEWP